MEIEPFALRDGKAPASASSTKRHHPRLAHGLAYLVKNGDLRGFEPEEIDIIALLTRYHRRATPKREHIGLTEFSKSQLRKVEILSAFLRLAETLDRSRHGVVRGIEARERLGQLFIKVQAVGDAELEVWAANKQLHALAEALDREITLEKVPYRRASAPSVALVTNSRPGEIEATRRRVAQKRAPHRR